MWVLGIYIGLAPTCVLDGLHLHHPRTSKRRVPTESSALLTILVYYLKLSNFQGWTFLSELSEVSQDWLVDFALRVSRSSSQLHEACFHPSELASELAFNAYGLALNASDLAMYSSEAVGRPSTVSFDRDPRTRRSTSKN